MCRKAFETSAFLGRGPFLFATGLAEPGGGAQRTQTWTFTGPATASGTAVFKIAGRVINVGVASGDSANTVAAALNAAIGALKVFLPVTAGVAARSSPRRTS
jgi:phage tail sheath gpL-like